MTIRPVVDLTVSGESGDALARELEALGVRVRRAREVPTRSGPADLTIVDLDGSEQNVENLRDLAAQGPMLGLSERDDPVWLLERMGSGLIDVIRMPCSAPLLAQRVRRALDSWTELRRLQEESARTREAHHAARMVTGSWESVGSRIDWGAGAESFWGAARSRLPNTTRRLLRRIHRQDRRKVCEAVLAGSRTHDLVTVDFLLSNSSGAFSSAQIRGQSVLDANGGSDRWTGILRWDTRSGGKSEIEEASGAAPVLEGFRRVMDSAVARARRHEWMVAVALLDLDRFGQINEIYGHDAGDRVLQRAADRIRATVREYDAIGRVAESGADEMTVSRLGGDKFVVLLEGLREPREAMVAMERILSRLSEPLDVEGVEVQLAARVGLTLFPVDASEGADLLRNAEAALQDASSASPSRIRFFSRSMAERHRQDVELERLLREAIANDSFGIAYQPKVLLSSGAPMGFEALLRFQHPETGPVPPPIVIGIAERSGLIQDLGHAIFRRVCRDAERAHRETGVPLRFFTNFSPRQLEMEDWRGRVESVLQATGVDPRLVGIEITESLLVRDRASLVADLESLVKTGIEISLDDFGTGYSHLGYLTRFPLHELKIDRSFVMGLATEQAQSAEVAGLVVMLGRSLAIRVVAEGAESQEQVKLLRAMGCHAAQGYYFARPKPLEEFFDAIRAGKIAPEEKVV